MIGKMKRRPAARTAQLMCLMVMVSASVRADDVDRYIQKRMEQRHIPGASVAVVRDGNIILAKGYGMANVELSSPATEQTVYQLASVTKQFTATAVMMLVEEGKVALDEKAVKYIDGLPQAWSHVTVRQLLDHTSGIKSYTGVEGFDKMMRKDFSKPDLLKLVTEAPMDFAPGEKWRYNNTGYFLLGMLIEKVSGKEYGAYLKERIFQPLGMGETRVNDLSTVIKNRAQGYTWRDGELKNGEYVSPTQPYSAGALVSTVLDLAKWDAALYTEKVLKRASLDQMWTPAKLNDGSATTYGFGWAVDVYRTRPRRSHGGGIPGFSTNIMRFVDDKLTVIVLTNSDGGGADNLASGIAEFYLPALAANAPKPIEDADPKTTQFLKDVFTKSLAGEASPDWFSADAQKFFFPNRIKDLQRDFGSQGPIKSFDLMEERKQEKTRSRGYRIAFADLKIRCTFTLNEEGKIAGVGLRPE
jgi:D-alanyl-D-alanine carboxypeptidase